MVVSSGHFDRDVAYRRRQHHTSLHDRLRHLGSTREKAQKRRVRDFSPREAITNVTFLMVSKLFRNVPFLTQEKMSPFC